MSDRILMIGDSWAACHEEDTGNQYGGVPDMLHLPHALRQAVCGSTAEQWANDFENRLTKAAGEFNAEVVIVSIGGNDAGSWSLSGIAEDVATVLNAVRKKRTILQLYTNPFPSNPLAEMGVGFLNSLLMNAAPPWVEIFHTSKVLDPSDFLQNNRSQIHPTREGWAKVAAAYRELFKMEVEP